MKLETNKQIEFTSNTVFKGFDASISPDDMHKLWDMLQNPYKNPIGAIVREYCSNSFDAHAEANFIKNHSIEEICAEYSIYKTVSLEELTLLKAKLAVFDQDAVIVDIDKDETGWFWSTEDFGVGLSPTRVQEVFVNYLKSTKESSNNVIGAFGLGSKSGLSYADIVFITTRYNNIEYNYMLRKGENGPRLDILSQENTEERNGTKIKIYIERNDVSLFKKACYEQLAYFDNIFYTNYCELSNDFKIVRGTHWIATTRTTPFTGLHICLGKVAYPIDFSILELPYISLNIALKFDIGELDVIQTREDVKYTPRTKQAIRDKIEVLREELLQRWKLVPKEMATIDEYYAIKNSTPELTFEEGKVSICLDVPNFLTVHNDYYCKPFRDAGIPNFQLPNRKEDLFFDYYLNGFFRYKFISDKQSVGYYIGETSLFRISGEHNPKKSKFIQQTILHNPTAIIRFLRKQPRLHLTSYIKWLKLKQVPKALWREQITAFQKIIEKEVINKTTSYDRVTITKEWLEGQKTVKTTKVAGSIKVTNHGAVNKYSGNIEISKILLDNSNLYILGTKEEINKLQIVYVLYRTFTTVPANKIYFYEVAQTNLAKLKNVKNQVTLSTFMKKENKVFQKFMSCLKFYKHNKQLYDAIKGLHAYTNKIKTIKNLSPRIYAELSGAIRGLEKEPLYTSCAETAFREACYKYALENNVFDPKLEMLFNHILQFEKELILLNNVLPIHEDENISNLLSEYYFLKNKVAQKKFPLNVHHVINYNSVYEKKAKKKELLCINPLELLPI